MALIIKETEKIKTMALLKMLEKKLKKHMKVGGRGTSGHTKWQKKKQTEV